MKPTEFVGDLNFLPAIESMDTCNYLVLQTSFYTANQMKAYKSLEAYNYFISGWVQDLGTKLLHDDFRLVFALVSCFSFHHFVNCSG